MFCFEKNMIQLFMRLAYGVVAIYNSNICAGAILIILSWFFIIIQ